MSQMRRTARRMLPNVQDSEDAVQDGLVLALRNLRQFEGRSSFSTWLHTIVKNAALSHLRRVKSRPGYALEEETPSEAAPAGEEQFVDPGLGPEEECSRRERSRILREVIRELPWRHEFAIRMCYFDGVEVKDAARKIGVTPCALKTHLFRARQRTARRMRERCFSAEQSCFENEKSSFLQFRESARPRKKNSVPRLKHAERERGSLNSRPSKQIELAGGNYDSKEKKSGFWECPVAPPVQSLVHNPNHPAC